MHADDAMELRMSWEESQELLRPPPTTQPTILVIEDCEFEAYDVSQLSVHCITQILFLPILFFFISFPS